MHKCRADSRHETLHEKCSNTDFFLVRISLYSVQIQENTGQKKLHIWTLFMQRKVFIGETVKLCLDT